MLQPELDRVGAGGARQFVHEALDREDVHVGAEAAQRRDPQRHLRHEMVDHPRVRGSCRAATALRSPPPSGCGIGLRRRRRERLSAGAGRGQQIAGRARPGRVGVAPDVVLPVGDLAARRRARRAPASASPGHRAPRHAPARASIARAPAGPGNAHRQRAPHRRRHRRRRYGRSSPSLPCGCSGSCRPAARASRRVRRAAG